jgi:hypothetical protein
LFVVVTNPYANPVVGPPISAKLLPDVSAADELLLTMFKFEGPLPGQPPVPQPFNQPIPPRTAPLEVPTEVIVELL